MSILHVAVAAVRLVRHPVVRAGLRAAPHLVTPRMREMAAEAALSTAYKAGVAVRRLVPKK